MKFKHYYSILNEANIFNDYRTENVNIFSALMYKNELILVDNPDGGKNFLKVPNKSVYSADIHIIVNMKKKTISLPEYEFNSIYVNNKRKYMKAYDTINPEFIKKIYNELVKRNIITSNFKIYNPEEKVKFDIKDVSTEYGKFYHGTTRKSADKILKSGLKPFNTIELKTQGIKSLFRGNTSTVKGFTDKNVYLSTSIGVAKSYASRQSNERNDEPVVLMIDVPDKSKLIIDDDYLLGNIKNEIKEKTNFIKLTKDNFEEHKRILEIGKLTKNSYEKYYSTDRTIPEYCGIWVKTPWTDEYIIDPTTYIHALIQENLFDIVFDGKIRERILTSIDSYYPDVAESMSKYIIDKIPKMFNWIEYELPKIYKKIINTNWQKSGYGEEQAIAYHGIILPKFIKEIKVEYKLRKY